MTPLEFVAEIDAMFEQGVKEGRSRMSTWWGAWSNDMNKRLRTYSEKNSVKALRYRYVFIYWALKSQILEHLFLASQKNRSWTNKNKAKQKKKEVQEILKIIQAKKPAKQLTKTDLLRFLIAGD